MSVARSILILLVMLAPLDDALANVTDGGDDDVLAHQNNEYLSRSCERARALLRDLCSLTTSSASLSRPLGRGIPGRNCPSGEGSGYASGPERLYLLMSLQR